MGRDPNLYFVNKTGSAPERFPIDRGRLCSFSPDGKKMVYQRKGAEDNYWKRYKGGQHTDIWMYDFATAVFTPISDYVGKNAYPMWVGDAMYFVSDRTNGVSNLYRENLATKAIDEVTTYSDVDVMSPSSDGETIVFLQDGYLHLLTSQAGKQRRFPSSALPTVGRFGRRSLTRRIIFIPHASRTMAKELRSKRAATFTLFQPKKEKQKISPIHPAHARDTRRFLPMESRSHLFPTRAENTRSIRRASPAGHGLS